MSDGPVTGREHRGARAACRRITSSRSCSSSVARTSCTSTRGAHGGYASRGRPTRSPSATSSRPSEHSTFDVHCVTHPVEAERCSVVARLQHPARVGAPAAPDRRSARQCAPERPADAGERGARARGTAEPVVIGSAVSRCPSCRADAPAPVRLFRSFRDDRALLRRSAAYAASLMQEPSRRTSTGCRATPRVATSTMRGGSCDICGAPSASSWHSVTHSTTARRPRCCARCSIGCRRITTSTAELIELAERQFNARLSAYRDAFTSRGMDAGDARRAEPARVFRRADSGDDPVVQRGAELVAEYLASAQALRSVAASRSFRRRARAYRERRLLPSATSTR